MKLSWLPLLSVAITCVPGSFALKFKRQDPKFVSISGDHFTSNGKPFKFVGTNAYWLPTLSSAEQINQTLASIAATNISVVRLWAFNDVTSVPTNPNETYFQLLQNGTFTINNGTNGLQRLDQTIELAAKHGLFVLLTLTNNWYTLPNATTTNSTTNATSNFAVTAPTPRGVLSNSYGGMDFYVKNYLNLTHHNTFYTDPKLIEAFKNYTTVIASRYKNATNLFGYELANDARCNSTLPASQCDPQDITRWHADISDHVKSVDPNHLIASGTGGFLCVGCPKIYGGTPTTPAPPTQSGSTRRRQVRQALQWKRTREILIKKIAQSKRWKAPSDIMIRGRWVNDMVKRQAQAQEAGSAYDGTFGVDTEDIANVPNISIITFQLFPDQNMYGVPTTIGTSPTNISLETGLTWITQQVSAAQTADKPSVVTGFGLVTQSNAPSFVPFNSSVAPYAASASDNSTSSLPQFVTDAQQISIYTKWINQAISSGIGGLIQYQWGESGLDTASTTVTPVTVTNSTTPTTIGTSPNDGYSAASSADQAPLNSVLSSASSNIAREASV